jgi:hypothetical protein
MGSEYGYEWNTGKYFIYISRELLANSAAAFSRRDSEKPPKFSTRTTSELMIIENNSSNLKRINLTMSKPNCLCLRTTFLLVVT